MPHRCRRYDLLPPSIPSTTVTTLKTPRPSWYRHGWVCATAVISLVDFVLPNIQTSWSTKQVGTGFLPSMIAASTIVRLLFSSKYLPCSAVSWSWAKKSTAASERKATSICLGLHCLWILWEGVSSFFFPKQFTVGVLNSILKCVRLVSGAVSASGRFVFQFICLPIHLSPRSCVRGCVRLRGICLPIHLSPNSFVSQVLCQGLCPPPGDLFPNSFVSQVLCQGLCPPFRDLSPIICFLSPVSGAVSASGGFVSQFICLPGPVSVAVSASGGFVSQFICPPCVRGCVRLRTICLPIHLSPNSFVSQVLVSQFICLPIHLSPKSCGRGCIRLRGIGFPIHLSPNSIVSQILCQGLCPPSGDLSPNSFVFHHLSPRSCVRGCVRLRGICLPIHLSPNSFVSQVLCQGLCPPPGDLFPNSFVSQVLCQGLCPPFRDLSPIICFLSPVSGAVSASGGFVSQFICLPVHLSPRSCVRGCVRLRTICLPIHLSALCQGLCPPPDDLSPNSFVSQFICLPGPCLPIHLSPNSFVSQVLWQGLCPPPGDWFPNSFVSHFICLPGPVSGAVSAFGGFVSQFVCLPSFPKQLTVGILNSILKGLCPPPWALCLPSFVSHPLSPMSCVRGCVRLPGLCVSHQSPNSLPLAFSILFQAVSGYVQMVVSGSPDVPNSIHVLVHVVFEDLTYVLVHFGSSGF